MVLMVLKKTTETQRRRDAEITEKDDSRLRCCPFRLFRLFRPFRLFIPNLTTLLKLTNRLASSQHSANFLIEGVSCGLDKESARIGHTMVYFLFGHWIERSQMTPYLKKLTAF